MVLSMKNNRSSHITSTLERYISIETHQINYNISITDTENCKNYTSIEQTASTAAAIVAAEYPKGDRNPAFRSFSYLIAS